MIFLDTNILMDVLEDAGTPEAEWSRTTLAAHAGENRLVANLIVAAELAGQMEGAESLGDTLTATEVDLLDLDLATAHRAGAAFRDYRRRGGKRAAILPDFLIAAHAATAGAALMTRDRRLGSYFPELTLITPDTDHG